MSIGHIELNWDENGAYTSDGGWQATAYFHEIEEGETFSSPDVAQAVSQALEWLGADVTLSLGGGR